MTDEEKAELRAMLVEVIGAACNSVQEQLGAQIAEVHDEIGMLCDRTDVAESDVSALRRQVARIQREQTVDRRVSAALLKRLAAVEGTPK